ncbi:hypothetical protein DNW83_25315 [Escherichia coli]|nr:hypothetical protein [Escherichia coli]
MLQPPALEKFFKFPLHIARQFLSLPDMLINFALINITDRKNEGTNTIDGNWQADERRRYRDNVRIYF